MATQLPYDESQEQESPGLGGLTSSVEPCARELFFDDAHAAEEHPVASSDYQPYSSKSAAADGQEEAAQEEAAQEEAAQEEAVKVVHEERPVHEEPGAAPEESSVSER